MKKLLVMASLVFIGAGSFAQTKKEIPAASVGTAAPAAKAEEHKDKYKDLNLTEDQKNKIKDLNKQHKADKAKIEADASLTAEQKATKLKDLKKEQSKSFKAILTPQQLETYKASKSKSKDNE